MAGTLSNGMCRCCASEGAYKDISSKYVWMGEEEVYVEMLQECFNINLANVESEDGGICEVCITQLRNAFNFKKQVQHTEEQFNKRLNDTMFKTNIVKVEISMLEEENHHSDNNDHNLSDEYSGPEFEVPVKTEVEETKGKKRTRAAATRAKKAKANESAEPSKRKGSDTSTVHVSNIEKPLLITDFSKSKEYQTNTSVDWTVTIKKKSVRILTVDQPEKQPPQRTRKKAVNKTPRIRKGDILKQPHMHNIRQLLLYTNATPIKNYDGIGYVCAFCNEQCSTPVELKKHTLEQHADNDKNRCFENSQLSTLMAKLDITDFKCILCGKDLNNLDDAVNHLKTEHDMVWHATKTNHILMFRYSNDHWNCSVCSNFFVSFKMAVEHMRMHNCNFTCDICNAPYITQRTLQQHTRCHPTGEYVCSFCQKVFDTYTKMRVHERHVHIGSYARYKCPECNAKFVTYKNKMDHMVEVHGREPIVYKCLACDRTFPTTAILNKHTRKDHLMEKPYKCEFCQKTFFSKPNLAEHSQMHTGKRYDCDICSKSYSRRHTLREHMGSHFDDRRHKCEFCDKAFIQKSTLKVHLRSKHKNILEMGLDKIKD